MEKLKAMVLIGGLICFSANRTDCCINRGIIISLVNLPIYDTSKLFSHIMASDYNRHSASVLRIRQVIKIAITYQGRIICCNCDLIPIIQMNYLDFI